jgi:hypothetical protein
MTPGSYDARIAAFSDGKRLRRFRGALRPTGDTSCDACGSMLPAMLYGLRDLTSGRDYFVGLSCLRQLHALGALEQPYVRMSIATAYVRARGAPRELQVYLRFGQRPERPTAATL